MADYYDRDHISADRDALNMWRLWAIVLLERLNVHVPQMLSDDELRARITSILRDTTDNLTATQTRCTELLTENRRLRGID